MSTAQNAKSCAQARGDGRRRYILPEGSSYFRSVNLLEREFPGKMGVNLSSTYEEIYCYTAMAGRKLTVMIHEPDFMGLVDRLTGILKAERTGTAISFLAGGAISVVAISWLTGKGTRRNKRIQGGALLSDSQIDCHRGKRNEDVGEVLRSVHHSRLLGLDTEPVALFYDLDALKETLLALRVAFPPHFLHCIAIKSNPLPFFLQGAVQLGFGLEAASMGEVQLALKAGCRPDCIVFDSPAKGRRDIAFSLRTGLQINADNFDELARIHEEQLQIQSERGKWSDSVVGVRINPLVGVGKIKALSVSGSDSKFGIPFTDANRKKLLAAFGEYPWLTALHCHVGSQGCSLEQHAEGARTLHEFANQVRTEYGHLRISTLDIGGGTDLPHP